MENALPTRLKIHIRDHISSENAALPTLIAKVSSTLGYPIIYDPEWAMLWTALQPCYPDQATFIPSIASVLITFFEYFIFWIESEENEIVVEGLLDELKPMGRMKLVLEVASPGKSERPVAQWRQSDKVFVILLPQARPSSNGTVYAGFATDFASMFTESSPVGSQNKKAATSAPAPEDWSILDAAEVGPVASSGGTTRERLHVAEPILQDEALPELAALERPDALMSRPPYRLVVKQDGTARVDVHGSHQGSLMLLESYLKRWVRHSTTLHTKPPLVDIKLKESVFGLGLLYDSLSIDATTQRGGTVNPNLVLALVEKVLGYDLVKDRCVSGSIWEFERKRGFK